MKRKLKNLICAILSVIMLLATMSPCFTAIAAEIEQNNVMIVGQKVSELYEEYDDCHQEKIENADIESLTVYTRIIVKTASKINTYDAVDVVYGLGYAFIQFENSESAQEAFEKYENLGYEAAYDVLYKTQEVSTSTSLADSGVNNWAYGLLEINKTLEYLNSIDCEDIVVGIIDSGIDYNHEVFKDRIIRTNKNFSFSGTANDEMDGHGHGTKCAGVVALSTPDNVKIEGFKIADSSGHLYDSTLIPCIEYILNMSRKPDVLNMSFVTHLVLTPNEIEKQLYNSLIDEGIVVVAGAGNENTYTDDVLPAGIENVITVAASDRNNKKCSFSNYGKAVDIAAPGANIYTAVKDYGYSDSVSGTSVSAPFVSAGAAIVLMQNPDLTPAEVCGKLQEAALPVQDPEMVAWCGAGILNFYNLIDTQFVSNVTFNSESKESNSDITVQMECADHNAKIYYTTDLTIPGPANGIEYTEPVKISTFTKIIAVAYDAENNKHHSYYTTEEYRIIKLAEESDFEINDKGVITAYIGTDNAIIVPDSINGITPTSIGEKCFYESSIQYIDLPKSITFIANYAFCYSNLKHISAEGLTIIGEYAFYYNSALSFEYMPNVKTVRDYAFTYCKNLTEFSFSEKVVNLNESSLENTSLHEAVFPHVTYAKRAFANTPIQYASLPKLILYDGLFYNCQLLRDIDISNVEYLQGSAFAYCYSLPTIMDFSNIIEVRDDGFAYSCFESLDLPNCERFDGGAFYDCLAKTIDLPICFIGCGQAFGRYVESINMPNLEISLDSTNQMFWDCINLKSIYLPKFEVFPAFYFTEEMLKQIEEGTVYEPVLEFIYAPCATELQITSYPDNMRPLTNLKFIYAPNLTKISHWDLWLPNSDRLTIYFSDALKLMDYNSYENRDIKDKYTIVAPSGSYAEQWANENNHKFLSSDNRLDDIESSNVMDLGRSICCSVAGLRFGFTWDNINEIESLASDIEYGFIYSQKGAEHLSIETVGSNEIKQVKADNRIDHGETTSFNLVISNIPNSYYGRKITARAYVYIDGMYFYSNIQKGSFSEVASLVLADDEINQATKDRIQNLLNREV